MHFYRLKNAYKYRMDNRNKSKDKNKKYYYSSVNDINKKKKEIPFFIAKYKKKDFSEELKNKNFRLFLFLKKKPFRNVKKGWLRLYHNRGKKYNKYKFFQYVHLLLEKWKSIFVLKKKKKINLQKKNIKDIFFKTDKKRKSF